MTTSIRFDASTDGLARTTAVFDPELNYTWAGWFRLAANNGTSYQTIAIVYCGGSAWDALYVDASRNLSVDVSGSAAATGDVLTVGTWYHLALRRTATNALEVYLDGTLTYTATTSATGRSAPSSMYLGLEEFGTWVNGNFAFWRLWDAAITTTELNTEKTATSAQRTTNLYADWALQSNANDATANARHWTVQGSVTFADAGPSIGGGGAQTVAAGVGSLALSGQAATVQVGGVIVAAGVGSLALLGQAATVQVGGVIVAAGVGSLALLGQAATVQVGGVIVAAGVGSLALLGQPATVQVGGVIVAAGMGSLALLGQAATVLSGTVVNANVGALVLAGMAVGVVPGAIHVDVGVGALTLTGQPVTVSSGDAIVVVAAVGSLALTGLQATVQVGNVAVAVAVGTLTLTGHQATVGGYGVRLVDWTLDDGAVYQWSISSQVLFSWLLSSSVSYRWTVDDFNQN